jgi:tripeptide aminopeptidase
MIVFVGNVGEEGEGDLRGMRHIYRKKRGSKKRGATARGWEIAAHIVLDGAGHESAVTHALGSQRYLVTITGPGGHSWTDAGRPNPIVLLSRAIERFSAVGLPDIPRTTMNVGTIEGGTAINAIPERASARIRFAVDGSGAADSAGGGVASRGGGCGAGGESWASTESGRSICD